MKICFIYNSVFQYGGVERVLSILASHLSLKHDVTIICNEKFDIKNNFYNIDLNKIKIIYKKLLVYRYESIIYRVKRRLINLLLDLNLILGLDFIDSVISKFYYERKVKNSLLEILKEKDFDVVIGGMMHLNLLLGSVAKKIETRILGWENNSYDSYFIRNGSLKSREKIIKKFIGNLDGFAVLTNNDSKKYKENLNISTIVIPNPLSFSTKKKSLLNKKTILTIARLEEMKGVDLIPEIIKEFSKLNSDWNFRLVGEGALKEKIEMKIRDYNLEQRISIVGFRSSIKNEYMNASIYLCPSRFESFGMTVLEAMGCGLPVVTFNTSGPSELVKNYFNGLITEKNIKKIAKALNLLVTNKELRERMSQNSVKLSKKYEADIILKKWESFLEIKNSCTK